MYRRIAVPVDGTTLSQQAIPWAVTIARLANCPIDLVQVAFPPAAGTELYAATVIQPEVAEAFRQIAQRDLQALANQIASTGIVATATVLMGEIHRSLIDHLDGSDADLVVMTTHDPGRIERLLVGSVAESVIRHIRLPVLLVRHDDTASVSANDARSIERMLIPLDGSAFGDAILPHATRLASLLRSEITLVGVMQPLLALAAAGADLGGPTTAIIPANIQEDRPDQEQTEAALRPLEQTAAPIRASGLTVRTQVLVDGQPARAIVDYAKQNGMDAIAMTTHGRGALKRILAGSVSQRVLRSSHLPMLIYRPHDQPASINE